jgi:hypothetical protein
VGGEAEAESLTTIAMLAKTLDDALGSRGLSFKLSFYWDSIGARSIK